jgi:hypothetical protein
MTVVRADAELDLATSADGLVYLALRHAAAPLAARPDCVRLILTSCSHGLALWDALAIVEASREAHPDDRHLAGARDLLLLAYCKSVEVEKDARSELA